MCKVARTMSFDAMSCQPGGGELLTLLIDSCEYQRTCKALLTYACLNHKFNRFARDKMVLMLAACATNMDSYRSARSQKTDLALLGRRLRRPPHTNMTTNDKDAWDEYEKNLESCNATFVLARASFECTLANLFEKDVVKGVMDFVEARHAAPNGNDPCPSMAFPFGVMKKKTMPSEDGNHQEVNVFEPNMPLVSCMIKRVCQVHYPQGARCCHPDVYDREKTPMFSTVPGTNIAMFCKPACIAGQCCPLNDSEYPIGAKCRGADYKQKADCIRQMLSLKGIGRPFHGDDVAPALGLKHARLSTTPPFRFRANQSMVWVKSHPYVAKEHTAQGALGLTDEDMNYVKSSIKAVDLRKVEEEKMRRKMRIEGCPSEKRGQKRGGWLSDIDDGLERLHKRKKPVFHYSSLEELGETASKIPATIKAQLVGEYTKLRKDEDCNATQFSSIALSLKSIEKTFGALPVEDVKATGSVASADAYEWFSGLFFGGLWTPSLKEQEGFFYATRDEARPEHVAALRAFDVMEPSLFQLEPLYVGNFVCGFKWHMKLVECLGDSKSICGILSNNLPQSLKEAEKMHESMRRILRKLAFVTETVAPELPKMPTYKTIERMKINGVYYYVDEKKMLNWKRYYEQSAKILMRNAYTRCMALSLLGITVEDVVDLVSEAGIDARELVLEA